MEKLNLDKRSLRKFGITMGAAFLAIALFILFKLRGATLPIFLTSAVFFMLAFISPNLLKPIYASWMRLAFTLNWITTRLILLIIFYLLFTPIGLIMRLSRIDLLDRKAANNRESYWKKKEKPNLNPLSYERQF